MKQDSSQKLIATSKKIIFMLRVFLVLLILVAIIPWLIPNSSISAGIFGFYGVPFNINHGDFASVINNFNVVSQLFGVIGAMVSLFPLFVGTIFMIWLSKCYIAGNVFTLVNAKLYSKLGFVYLFSAILLQPISQILFSLAVSINNPAGHRFINISFSVGNLTAIFFALVLIVIGQVMQLGHKISEEQDLTI